VARIDLWSPPPQAVVIGASVIVQAGCDKALATCSTKFANAANFRGFPHIPGNDFVMQVASAGDPANDGGRRES
jgi:uncharacterized phage protein (TIGR02218 family)